ncbi:E3 ubiquitin-protein ligase XIAP-like [Lingula anatina]|uniref:E3 ubiquitin-protein ligase XIAP-like n=1 Tax=Lingula anatina TaxID=7574 RepID=A0A1S3K698_LINAN|nr:E3 ubiquitin-protein ligase XIAP-like [Lingula anatina]|eukprot:XP_013418150.1 E3 ubiquitin-protein ligase XIAP-like [Lingula anatina]
MALCKNRINHPQGQPTPSRSEIPINWIRDCFSEVYIRTFVGLKRMLKKEGENKKEEEKTRAKPKDRQKKYIFKGQRYYSLCPPVQQRQSREQSSTQQNNLLFDDNPIVTERPKHPQYAIEQNRILTFENWPVSKRQTPRELSIAGFYYAGFGDNVKCFFCGGELRNWEPQDDVWTEHARWFPNCGYVKQCKGVTFIREILQRNSANCQFSGQVGRSPHTHQIEAREIEARLDTPSVQKIIEIMGYSRIAVRKAIENRLKSVGDDFPNLLSLVEAIGEIEERQELEVVDGDSCWRGDPQNGLLHSGQSVHPMNGKVVVE